MILTTIALVAQATPAATATPTATATPDAKISATAKTWFLSLQQGKVLDAKALSKEMAAAITPDGLSQLASKLGPLGDPTSFEQSKTGVQGDNTYYVYDVGFKNGLHLNFMIAFDTAGKISGMRAFPQQ